MKKEERIKEILDQIKEKTLRFKRNSARWRKTSRGKIAERQLIKSIQLCAEVTALASEIRKIQQTKEFPNAGYPSGS